MHGFKTIEEFTLEECEAFLKRNDISGEDRRQAECRKAQLLAREKPPKPNSPKNVMERFPDIKFVHNPKRNFIPVWLWVVFAAAFLYSFGGLLIAFLILYPKRRKQLIELFIEETKGRFVLVSDLYKVGLYHKFTMTILVPIEYDSIERIHSNFFVVEKNGKKGLYKRKEIIIPVEYDKIQWNGTNNIFIVEKNGRQIFVDINGNELK